MRVFVTGASGWIGSAAVAELLASGHDVVGLARSDGSAQALVAAGARVARGDLDDTASLRAGARDADAVLHLAFKHDFSDFLAAGRTERAAIEALGDELAGSGRALLLASGLAAHGLGRPLTEEDRAPQGGPDSPRGGSEALALSFAERGIRPVAVRFAPTVHGENDHGFTAQLARVARTRGVVGYVGEGTNRWAAVHRADAARLIRLALEDPTAGPAVHAVAEAGIPTREIAVALADRLGLPVASIAPEDAEKHFGWIGGLFSVDMVATSDLTRRRLGWEPTGPGLREDIAAGFYDRA